MYSYNNLSFYYGKKRVINNISFNVNNRDLIVLIGNNGVGKTTLLKSIINYNINNNYVTSYMIDNNPFLPNLSAYDNLKYYCILYDISYSQIDYYFNMFSINEYKFIKYKKLSLGTKQKLAIIRTLIIDADIYIFDEPYNGLDIKTINIFNHLCTYIKNKNKCIFITTHLVNEIKDIATRYFVINNGQIDFYNTDNINDYIKNLGESKNA